MGIEMSTFVEIDQDFRAAIESPAIEMQAAYKEALSTSMDLSGVDMTEAILLRHRSFLRCQDGFKKVLGKRYGAASSDFFVESVCFYLKVVIERLKKELGLLDLRVESERQIERRRKAMRPDISVWSGEKVIAAIECKTQLGWRRDGWRSDFDQRERQLHSLFPDAEILLLVLTGGNWGGFADDEKTGNQFFVLLRDKWPNEFESSQLHNLIQHRVEELYQRIVALVRRNLSSAAGLASDGEELIDG